MCIYRCMYVYMLHNICTCTFRSDDKKSHFQCMYMHWICMYVCMYVCMHIHCTMRVYEETKYIYMYMYMEMNYAIVQLLMYMYMWRTWRFACTCTNVHYTFTCVRASIHTSWYMYRYMQINVHEFTCRVCVLV
jgi:hypothetical protein